MSCVVKGPLHLGQTPWSEGQEGSNNYLPEDSYDGSKVITVKRNDVYFMDKTPVECHDLDGKNSHCNGKIGTVITTKGDDVLLGFEDPALGKKKIKRGNLRVVKSLPLIRDDVPFPFAVPFTPVVCQGFNDFEKHLNGQIGTIIGIDEKYNATVVFDDPNIPSSEIPLKNLRTSSDLAKRVMPNIR